MGGFQNMVMWREWRQVVFSCLCRLRRGCGNIALVNRKFG